jgi:hypothetical protein
VNSFVLYLNLWGTTAKLWESTPFDDLFSATELLNCQYHFHKILFEMPETFLNVEVIKMGDLAYVTSQDLETLLRLSCKVFQEITLFQTHAGPEFKIWPIRGAIASQPASKDLFLKDSLFGTASVESAYLEKSGQKGMRLFLSSQAIEKNGWKNLENEPHQLLRLMRPRTTRGLEHLEVNWMVADEHSHNTSLGGYLKKTISDRTIEENLRTAAKSLIEIESNYCQQLGASIRDLLDWSQRL